MRVARIGLGVLVALWATVGVTGAQSTSGTISGRVVDGQGLAMPGVTITVSSPALQGTRTVVTTEHGDYIVPLLPSGAYELQFEIDGFETTRRTVPLSPTQKATLDVQLGIQGVTQTVVVSGKATEILTQTAQVTTNFKQELVSQLPTARDVTSAILLAPAVHATGPGGTFSVAGSVSFESLFLVNGVTATENIRGQVQQNLVIEDAIQETTVATGGVSAEFGRFTGGVVNVVTKAGGNLFSGSFRDTLANDNWRAQVKPRAGDIFTSDTKLDAVVPTYEYTLGGPVLKNRLWFFTAGRTQTQQFARQLIATNFPYTFTNAIGRYEGKATLAVNASHRVQAAFTKVSNRQENYVVSTALAMDPRMLQERTLPEQLVTANYTGVLGSRWFVEARYSARDLSLDGTGARATDRINGTQLMDTAGRMFWTDLFCGVCGAERRDNRDLFAKATYFLSTPRFGSHQIVGGVDAFNDQRFANNHQSGSDYFLLNIGSIVRDTTIYPQITNNAIIRWRPIFLETQGTDFRTNSLFLNDSWAINGRLTANLGLRWDKNHGRNGAGQLVSTAGALSPRLGVTWDPTGGQVWSVTASASKYAAGLLNSIADATSAGGNPDRYDFVYGGPSINANPNAPLVPADAALAEVFAWFDANGGIGRPIAGTPLLRGVSAAVGELRSPSVREYAVGASRNIGQRLSARADLVYRNFNDFYAQRTDLSTGRVSDTRSYLPAEIARANATRTFDLTIVENSDLYERQYVGLSTQVTYRVGSILETGATYTLSRAWGNTDAESFNAGPTLSDLQSYPEYKQASWYSPAGDLAIDQRHRARLWAAYLVPGTRGLSLSALQTLESGVPYGAVSASGVDITPHVTNPGYLTPPGRTQTTYYFTARDAFRTEGQRRTDLAATFTRRVPGIARLEGFAQFQIVNLFNQSQLCGCGGSVFVNGAGVNTTQTINTAVMTSVTSPATLQNFNPFTTTPVEGVNWAKGPNFGRAATRFAYTTPRMLRISFGVRF
jgi:hypothetical protein